MLALKIYFIRFRLLSSFSPLSLSRSLPPTEASMSFYHAFHNYSRRQSSFADFGLCAPNFRWTERNSQRLLCRQSRKLKAMLTRNFCFLKLKRRTIWQFQVFFLSSQNDLWPTRSNCCFLSPFVFFFIWCRNESRLRKIFLTI